MNHYQIDIKHLVETILEEDKCTTYVLIHRTEIPSRSMYNITSGKVQDCSFSVMWKLLVSTGRDFKWLDHYYRSYCAEMDREMERLKKIKDKEVKKKSESDATS